MKDPNRFLFPLYLLALVGVAAGVIGFLLHGSHQTAGGWDRRPGEVIFTGWGGPEEKDTFTKLIASFEKANPDIHIRYIIVPQNYMQKLQIMMAGGTPPDVFYIPDAEFPNFVVKKAMEPLTPYVQRSALIKENEFWPSALLRYRYDGKSLQRGPLYALPKDIGPFAMFYNKALFQKAGIPYPSPTVPWTWTEGLAAWKKLTIPNKQYPEVMDQFGAANFPLEAAVWSNGGDYLSKDGRRFTMPDDPRAVEAMQWVADMSLKAHCAPTPRQARSFDPGPMFDTGKLACIFAGRWNVPHFRTLNFDWDVAPIPVSPRTRKEVCWSGSVGLAMSKTCVNKAAAWKFIEYIVGPEGQKVQALTGFQIPNQRYLATTPYFLQRNQRPLHAEVFIPAAKFDRPGPNTQAPSFEWMDEFNQRTLDIWEGNISAADGLKAVRPYVQKGLDNAWQQEQ